MGDTGKVYGPFVPAKIDQYIAGQCTRGEVKTPFATGHDMDQMKDMLRNADPGTVLRVAAAWKRVSDMLISADGNPKTALDQAVAHIMQHWEGTAADGFRAKAQKISQSITDTATYAQYTSTAMKSAGTVLQQIQPEVMAMEKPSKLSSVWDYATDGGDRSDAYKNDLDKSGKGGAQNALDKDSGSLSAGKEAQLKMAAKMETLAVAYSSQTAIMGTWKTTPRKGIEESKEFPGDPGGVPPVPVMVSPEVATPRGSTSNGSVRSGSSSGTKTPLVNSPKTMPRDTGITGGAQKPLTNTQPVGTSVDGITGGLTGGSRVGGGTAGIGTGGSIGAVSGGVGGGSGAAGLPGAGGGLGATSAGAAGAAGRGSGAMGGRGMPGASGAGAGKVGAGGKSGSGRGSLARMRGGVVGEAEEGAAGKRGAQGGSGLHQSRGAVGKGQAGSKGRNGMMGRGSHTDREEEEQNTGQRPDYLVEDEETWVPDSDVTPRVIE